MHYLDYNEKTKHGTDDFPIGFYHVNELHPRYNMPFHWHREAEIIYILEGCFCLYLDDEKLSAKAGDIIFINGGVIHGGIPWNCIYECVVFDMKSILMHTNTCRSYIRKILSSDIIVRNHFSAPDQPISHAVSKLFSSLKKKAPGSELITMGTLYEFFGEILINGYYKKNPGPAEESQTRMDILKPVLEYIDQNYASSITLSDLSKVAGMSSKYFCRYFRTVIHKTPMDYLNYYRIERACFFLTSQDITVTEAGFLCGFRDSSYFVRIFRKYKGITPKQYIRQTLLTD